MASDLLSADKSDFLQRWLLQRALPKVNQLNYQQLRKPGEGLCHQLSCKELEGCVEEGGKKDLFQTISLVSNTHLKELPNSWRNRVSHYSACFQGGGLSWGSPRPSASSAPSWVGNPYSQGYIPSKLGCSSHLVANERYDMLA